MHIEKVVPLKMKMETPEYEYCLDANYKAQF